MKNNIYFLSLILITAVACGTANIKNKVKSLDDAVTDYNVSLRWSMLDNVEAYHLRNNGEKIPLDRSAMSTIRITGCTVLEQSVNEDVSEAVIKGEIDYYTTNTGTLKNVPFTHIWWYSDMAKRWYNGSDYPQFK
ncbi:MAG: hypothetical protein HW386_692 [Gammaproteobacteria bacterium]|nr:hypothetical protein [Gammaproteobacteria bacterium]